MNELYSVMNLTSLGWSPDSVWEHLNAFHSLAFQQNPTAHFSFYDLQPLWVALHFLIRRWGSSTHAPLLLQDNSPLPPFHPSLHCLVTSFPTFLKVSTQIPLPLWGTRLGSLESTLWEEGWSAGRLAGDAVGISTCDRMEGKEAGWAKANLGCNEISTKTTANPQGALRLGWPFRAASTSCSERWSLYSPASASHWMQTACGKGADSTLSGRGINPSGLRRDVRRAHSIHYTNILKFQHPSKPPRGLVKTHIA